MPQRGDIVVERLTGRRAIVINVETVEEVTCRFADGRLEDRFVFELEPANSLVGSLLSLFGTLSAGRARENPPPSLTARVRPLPMR